MAARFLARAVRDEILPPAYLADEFVCTLAGDIVEQAKVLLTVPHSAERLEHVWNVTGAATLPEIKDAIRAALLKYFSTDDADEAERTLRALGVPHFLHEVVYRAVTLAIDTWPAPARADAAIALFRRLHAADLLGTSQLQSGFRRALTSLPDLTLDAPHARVTLDHILAAATAAGIPTLPSAPTPAPEPAAAAAASGGAAAAAAAAAATT